MVESAELQKRQQVLAHFGELVLSCEDLQAILNEGCRLVADALGTDLAKILEIEHETNTGIVRAGIGWNDGVVGRMRVELKENSSESYALGSSRPVITRDITAEKRFEFPRFLRDHGVVAIVNVPILLPGGQPFGLLQVDAREPRAFGEDEIEFLRTYAMVLGPVIDRLRLKLAAEHLRLIVENARDYAILLCDCDGLITDWLPGAAAVFGWTEEEAVGRPCTILFTPEDRANGVPAQEIEKARRHGCAPEVRWHLRKDGSRVFIDGQLVALRRTDGSIRGFMKIGKDVSERKRDEELQGVLLAELQHRVRNVLAMVRSIVNRGGDGRTVAEFRADLDGRIAAMARTQAHLTRGAGVGVDLEALVRDELAVHAGNEGRVNISGPPVTLAARAAEILSLGVHELATNALKYGALYRSDGHIVISWEILPGAEGWLRFTWRERGVTIAPASVRRIGFGTELVTRRVPYELGGRGGIDFLPDGLICEITFPMTAGQSTLQTDAPAAFHHLKSPSVK